MGLFNVYVNVLWYGSAFLSYRMPSRFNVSVSLLFSPVINDHRLVMFKNGLQWRPIGMASKNVIYHFSKCRRVNHAFIHLKVTIHAHTTLVTDRVPRCVLILLTRRKRITPTMWINTSSFFEAYVLDGFDNMKLVLNVFSTALHPPSPNSWYY